MNEKHTTSMFVRVAWFMRRTAFSPRTARATSMVALAALLVLIAFAMAPTPIVHAAVTVTVDRNDDPTVTTAGSGAAACTAAANDCSIRGATLVANANPGSTIDIPAGTYLLSIDGNSEHGQCGTATIGDLDIAGNNTTITGAGKDVTTIEQTTSHDRVICVDQFLVHNFTFTMSGVKITGGKETWGVGGGGMVSGDVGDSVTLSDMIFDNNLANKTSGGGSPIGGGVEHQGGSFSCTRCTFSNNSSGGSGGGLYLSANYTSCVHPCAGTYTITNSTFSSNTAGGNGGGLITTSGNSYSVTNSTFTNNTAQSAAGGGGGIYDESGSLTANTNTFTGNQATGGSASGNAFGSADGAGNNISANFNRIVDNSGSPTDVRAGTSSTNSITDNWWGCDGGPGFTGCDTVGGGGTNNYNPWIVLKTTASPSTINYGDSTTLTTSFLQNSSGGVLTAAQIAVLIGLPVTWTNAAHGTLSNQVNSIQNNGEATATFLAGSESIDCGNMGKAEAEVDNVQSPDATATASVTVNCPDLQASKTNNVSGQTQLVNTGSPALTWTWTITGTNFGPGQARYSNGQTILTDNLPNSNISYGVVTENNVSGVTGTISCSINVTDDLSCTANGAVNINSNGSLTAKFVATPAAVATYANPRAAGGICAIDPNNSIPETSDANSCNNGNSDNVTVTAPDLTVTKSNNVSGAMQLPNNWTWKLHVANGASNASATFLNGDTILTDNLDNSGNLLYGTPTAGNGTNITNIANISCSITSNTLTCSATGTVVVGTSGSLDVTFTATPSAIGSYANPRSGSICAVDVNNVVPESNEANNNCNNGISDNVTVTAPDLTVTKSNNVSGATTLGSNWTWKLHVANSSASATATFHNGDKILTDDLDNSGNLSYGTATAENGTNITNIAGISCSIASNTLTCSATGTVVVGTSGSLDVTFTVTPSAIGAYSNPRSLGTCDVDPNTVVPETNEANNNCNTDSVTVTAPDLTMSKANNVGGTVIQGQGYNWTLTITNTGNAGAIFAAGATLVRDDLDNSGGLVYGTPSIQNVTNVTNSGSIQCSINGSQTLTCVANGSTVTVGATTGNFQVVVPATTIALGTYTNPRSASICRVDPNNTSVESDESNNDCTPNSVTVVRSADLQVSKSGPSTVTVGSEITYTVIITNAGPTDAVNVVVDDTLPGATNFVTQTQTSGPSFTLTHGGNAIHDTLSSMFPGNSAIFQFVTSVPGSVADGTTLVNTATISSDTSDPNSLNNSSTVTTTVHGSADLAITKTVASPVFAGTDAVYTVTLKNNGPSDAQNVSLTDTLPVSTTYQSQSQSSGPSFTLSHVGNAITDTISPLPAGATAVFQFTTQFDAAIPNDTTITNTATVASSTTDPTSGNNSSDAATLVQAGHLLSMSKSHVGNFRQGDIGDTYTLTVTNSGTLPTDGTTVFVTDTLPSGLTATNIAGTNWSCTLGSLSCTRTDVLNAGLSYEPVVVTVNVANNAAASVTNTATVSGGGAVTTASETANDQTDITQVANLTISKSHNGNFAQGQVGATYTITATNVGDGSTSSTVDVTDTLPSGLTPTGFGGTGWSCTLSPLACSRSDALAPSSSYSTLTLTVTVASDAPAVVTNTVQVAGGGETVTNDDTANDQANIKPIPDLAIVKAHSGPFTQGLTATWTLTVTNNSANAASSTDGSSVTVLDTLPTGYTLQSFTGTNWNCTGTSTVTCTSSDVVAGGGGNFPLITLTVNVPADSPAFIQNIAKVFGGGDTIHTNAGTAAVSNTDTVTVIQVPASISINGSGTQSAQINTAFGSLAVTVKDAGNVVIPNYASVVFTASTGGNGQTGTFDNSTGTKTVSTNGAGIADPGTFTANAIVGAYTVDVGAGSAPHATFNLTNVAPDLTISKSHSGNFRQGDTGDTYTLTVHNVGTGPTDGSTVTVTDTLPSGLTATNVAGAGWNCPGNAFPCTSTAVVGSGSDFPNIILTVNVANNASSSVTNNAGVSGGGELDTSDDTASDPTAVTQVADLVIAKTHSGNFAQGQVGASYTITVSNTGPGSSTGAVTITDTLPSGLTASQILGVNWSCNLGNLTCTRSDALASGNSYEPITLQVNVANNASASVNNSVVVAGGGELNTSNDTATDPTTITQFADLTIVKSHSGAFKQGDVGRTYLITVTNTGNAPTDGSTVTVTDTLPSGLTATNVSGSGWTCPGNAFPCTRSSVLGAGLSYPALTLTVNVSLSATTGVNSAGVSGGGEIITNNDTANDPTTINPIPNLTISKSHSGNFRQGDSGDTYTLTVHNVGPGPTDGSTVTVTDTLPSGLTATNVAGSGWTCPGNAFPCTSTAIVASGSDFQNITLTVNVANNASSSVTNNAGVSGGGELDTSDNTASDPTTVTQVADLVIAKTHSGNFAQGQIGASYTITVSNTGPGPSTGTVNVNDTLPSGLTATSVTGTNWTCPGSAFPCTRTDALASGSGYEPITLTVNVAYSASPVVTNTVTVSGGGELNTGNDSANNPTTITQYPDLIVSKSHSGTFIQGDTGKVYTITVSNVGSVATTGATVMVTDTMPPGLSADGWSGSGWNCNIGTLDCTRSDVIGAGASYPVITLTVDIANNATSGTNSVVVAGGGEVNTANDTANDSTTITPFQNITISGTKFNDLNGNGVKNGGEPGLAGWTIQLINPSNSNVISSTITGASGDYSFPNLAKSTYRIREVAQAGWVQTTANPADVAATSGVDVTGVNFGNFQQITISGLKFNDLSGDGVQQGGEPGLTGWTIQLINPSNSNVISTTTTGASGDYSFPSLGPGTYRVREVQQTGWLQTTTNPADITSSSGTDVTGVLFGNVLPANLTLTKKASPTNPVKGGLLTYTLVLTNTGPNTAQNVVVTDTTPAHTTFHSLTDPGGWTCSTPAVGGTGTINCSIASVANGATATFQLVVLVDANTPDNTTITNTAHVTASTFQSSIAGNNPSSQVSISNFLYYLPFIGRNIAIGPDLYVQSISTPGNADIQVVLKNIGNQPTGAGFWVDLYVNPNPVPTQPNQTWPFVASQGAVWGITSNIPAGSTLTLNIGDANYWPSSGSSPLSNMPATLPAGTKIYVQVDSARVGSSYGAILETNETNNVTGVQLAAPITLPSSRAPARQLPYRNLPDR